MLHSPEMKVERLTYQYMTPSAARGALEAICWHPQFRWVITQIEVLKPVHYQSVTRNEVQKKIPAGNIAGWMREPDSMKPFTLSPWTRGRRERDPTEHTRSARCGLQHHGSRLVDGEDLRPDDTPRSTPLCFERRVEKGQCFLFDHISAAASSLQTSARSIQAKLPSATR